MVETTHANCLSDQDLEAYHAGKLSGAAATALKGHLESCVACFERYTRLVYAQSGADATQDASASSKPPHDPDAPPAVRIYGFEIIRELGRGGMGIVYEAIQIKLQRRVALKVLPAVSTASADVVERFKREATAAAKLHHTNIVPIYDFGQTGHTHYYAMEMVDGLSLTEMIPRFAAGNAPAASATTLAELISARSKMARPEVVLPVGGDGSSSSFSGLGSHGSSRNRLYYLQVARWFADVADGLHYAHAHGIIHRDIKPANLMLSQDNRIMILDFGLAKNMSEMSVTMTGSLLGTLRYMSPEQAMAKRMKVDHRTDIYSLGATMYELLTFQAAFRGADEKETLGMIITKDPAPPRKVIPHVPKDLETICLKTLEKDPESRYVTAKELGDDLRRFVEDLPIVAKPVGPIRRVVKHVRRKKALAIAVSASLICLVAILAAKGYKRRAEIATANERNQKIESLLKEGRTQYNSHNLDAAEANYQAILALEPNNVLALINLANTKKEQYYRNPQPILLSNALVLMERALSADPMKVDAWNGKGVVLRLQNKLDEAIAVHLKVTQLAPASYPSWVNLGTDYALIGNLSAAADALASGVKLATRDAELMPYYNLAAVQCQLGRIDCLSTIEGASKLFRGSPDLFILESRAHLALQGADGSLLAQESATAARKVSGASMLSMHARVIAEAELRNQNWKRAAEFAQQSLDLSAAQQNVDLKDPPAWSLLIMSIAEKKLGHIELSGKYFNDAKRLWPADFDAHGLRVRIINKLLWFDSLKELKALRDDASSVLGAARQ